MDLLHYTVTFIIILFTDNILQSGVSVNAEKMDITGQKCVGYLDLRNENLSEIQVRDTPMKYFPEGNCSSAAPDEEVRVLDLPNVKGFFLMGNALYKMPNVSGMLSLENFAIHNT